MNPREDECLLPSFYDLESQKGATQTSAVVCLGFDMQDGGREPYSMISHVGTAIEVGVLLMLCDRLPTSMITLEN